jgi:hypothetical protein
LSFAPPVEPMQDMMPAMPQMAPPPPPPIDTSRVEKRLLRYVHELASRSKKLTKTEVWDSIEAARAVYGTGRKAVQNPDIFKNEEFTIEGMDLADQVDEMAALVVDLLFGGTGEIFRLSPKAGATEQQVETTQMVIESFLRQKNWKAELRKVVACWLKYRYCGLKINRTRETEFHTEIIDVPLEQIEPLLGMYPDMQPEDALAAILSEQGLAFQGYADELPDPDPMTGEPIFTMIRCTKTTSVERSVVFPESINPATLGISDVNRKCKDQYSLHEFLYLTLSQMQRGGYRNLDKLIRDCSGHPGGPQQPGTASGNTSTEPPPEGSKVYTPVGSWVEITWNDWRDNGDFDEDQMLEFAKQWAIPPTMLAMPGFKFYVVHYEDKVLHKLIPCWLMDKADFPHEVESFIFDEVMFCGQGMMERMSGAAAALHAFRNMVAQNMRKNLALNMLVSKRIAVTDDDLKRLDGIGQKIWYNGQAVDLQQDLRVFEYPDYTKPGMEQVGYYENKIRSLGVPAVLAGEGSADTATQDVLNNRRGQTTVNESFRRLVEMIVRSIEKMIGAVNLAITRGQWVEKAGEEGAATQLIWVTPSDITDKVEVVPQVSFDDANNMAMAQFLMALSNVYGPFLMPPEIRAMLTVCLQLGRVPKKYVEQIEQSMGSVTNVQQEIEAMLADENCRPKINMSDPHPICIAMAEMAMMQRAQIMQQHGMPFTPPLNIIEYIQQHTAMLQQMQMLAAMQQPQQEQGGVKGKSKQQPKSGPDDAQGETRQIAQGNSPSDAGNMTNGGMTGQAMAVPAPMGGNL